MAGRPSEHDVRDVLAPAPDRMEDLERVSRILERALNYRMCVQVLHEDLDVPDEVIAEVARVHVGTVRRWRSFDPDVGEPRQAQAQAIERLRTIALVLASSGTFYDIRGVGVWLRSGREELDWRAPFDVLAADGEMGYRSVLEAANRFVRPGEPPAGFGPPSYELVRPDGLRRR